MSSSPKFYIVTGKVIDGLLASQHAKIIEVVRETYLAHHAGQTVNPDSYFLRFDEKPSARIIALPAAIKGKEAVSGIKWIASYPENVQNNLQRASASLLLNDYETGYPVALLEASQISAARTAASCVLAAQVLSREKRVERLAVIGAGLIARSIMDYFRAEEWEIGEVVIHALSAVDSRHLADFCRTFCRTVHIAEDAPSALRASSHVVLATTAATPYLHHADLLAPGQVVLNISLRDLAPQLLLGAFNVFDDVEHCMKAATSPHLAELLTGGRDFVSGVLAQVIRGELPVDRRRPIIFSPFGLGVLDVAVGRHLLHVAKARDLALEVQGFFPDVSRW